MPSSPAAAPACPPEEPAGPRFAAVVPLVTARALSLPFTYRADGLGKGSVVSVSFGKASRRGVVLWRDDGMLPERH